MNSKILTRFEIFVNGESQGIGFLKGVEDMEISERLKSSLLYTFNKELPMPPRDIIEYSLARNKVNIENLFSYYKNAGNGKRLVSYFTQKGLKKFNMQIQNIINVVNRKLDYEYTIGKIVLDKDDDLVVYEDEYQVIQISDDLSDITSAISWDLGLWSGEDDEIYSIVEKKIGERDIPFTRFSLLENKEASYVRPDITIYPFYRQGYLKYVIDRENKLLKITSEVFDD